MAMTSALRMLLSTTEATSSDSSMRCLRSETFKTSPTPPPGVTALRAVLAHTACQISPRLARSDPSSMHARQESE